MLAPVADARLKPDRVAIFRKLVGMAYESLEKRNRLWGTFFAGAAVLPAISTVGEVVQFERTIARTNSLQEASAEVLEPHVEAIRVDMAADIPAEGPLLIVSNHPGLADALSLLASIPRRDLMVMNILRGLLPVLPNYRNRTICVDADVPLVALKQTVQYLRAGGAVLMFPAGKIEPDPQDDLEGARASLADWSKSVDLIAKRVPGLTIVPVAVGHLPPPLGMRIARRIAPGSVDDQRYLIWSLVWMMPKAKSGLVFNAFGKPLRGEAAGLPTIRSQMHSLLEKATQ